MHIKQIIIFFVLITVLFVLSGCAGVIEIPRRVLEISPYSFKENHIGRCGYSQIFNSDYEHCYGTILEILKKMDVNVFYRNKKEQYILATDFDKIFAHCFSTTKLCVFFEEIDSYQTQAEVVYGNPNLAEFAFKQIFSDFKQKLLKKG